MDDADVEVLDEEDDGGSGVGSADADFVEVSGYAEGDFPGWVDPVTAEALVGVGGAGWGGFRARVVGGGRGPAG